MYACRMLESATFSILQQTRAFSKLSALTAEAIFRGAIIFQDSRHSHTILSISSFQVIKASVNVQVRQTTIDMTI